MTFHSIIWEWKISCIGYKTLTKIPIGETFGWIIVFDTIRLLLFITFSFILIIIIWKYLRNTIFVFFTLHILLHDLYDSNISFKICLNFNSFHCYCIIYSEIKFHIHTWLCDNYSFFLRRHIFPQNGITHYQLSLCRPLFLKKILRWVYYQLIL